MFLPVSVLSTGSVLPSKLPLSSPGGDDAIDRTQVRTNTITTKGTNGSKTTHFNWKSFVSSAAIKRHHYKASYRKVKTNIFFFLMYHSIFNSDIFKFDCKSIFTIYAKPSEQIKGSLPNYKQQCMIYAIQNKPFRKNLKWETKVSNIFQFRYLPWSKGSGLELWPKSFLLAPELGRVLLGMKPAFFRVLLLLKSYKRMYD